MDSSHHNKATRTHNRNEKAACTRIMNKHIRTEMFQRWREANPHPTTELQFSTPFELLIAVLLSAQATDAGVNKATAKLFPVANTPQAMLDLGLEHR